MRAPVRRPTRALLLGLTGAALGGLLATGARGAPPQDQAPPPAALQPLVGEIRGDLVEADETLLDVAFRHRLGFDPVRRMNPQVDVWIPDPGTVVRLPTRAILPDAPHEGLVINVPEMRLYDYSVEGAPALLSVAVGDAEDPTILGSFRVGAKRTDPAWHVPESIRREKPELPAVVPPGSDNPLGTRWMTIGTSTYGIHGTNNRWSIGREATHGCVRLYEDVMRDLYERVPEGTPLHLVYQTIKWGSDRGRLFVEVHPDLYHRVDDPRAEAQRVLEALGLEGAVDAEALDRALAEVRGVPVPVGVLPPPSGAPGTAATSAPPS